MRVTAYGTKLDVVDNELVEDNNYTPTVEFEIPENAPAEQIKEITEEVKLGLSRNTVRDFGLDWFAVRVTFDCDKFEDFVVENVYYWPGQQFLSCQ